MEANKKGVEEVRMGTHFIGDLSGCRENYTNGDTLKNYALAAVTMAGMTPVGDVAVTIGEDDTCGATMVMVVVPLKESHLSIHTWPEMGYAAIDLFTCGDMDKAKQAFDAVVGWFDPKWPDVKIILRMKKERP